MSMAAQLQRPALDLELQIDLQIDDAIDIDALLAGRAGADAVPLPAYPALLARIQTAAAYALSAGPLRSLRRRVWADCVLSALVGDAVASAHGVAAETAYVAGLLHDFGKIIALRCIEENVKNVEESDQFWLDIIEAHHCDLGFHMAERWGLPSPIPEVIASHHQHLSAGRIAILDVMYVCDAVCALGLEHASNVEALMAVQVVHSREEAALIARAVDKLPHVLGCFEPPPALVASRAAQTNDAAFEERFLAHATRVAIATTVVGTMKPPAALTIVAVARGGLAIASGERLAEGWVTHIEVQAPAGAMRLWITVVSTRQQADGSYLAEAKPMGLRGASADAWNALVDHHRRHMASV